MGEYQMNFKNKDFTGIAVKRGNDHSIEATNARTMSAT